MNFRKTKLAISLTLLMQLPVLAQNSHYEAGQKAMHNQQYQKAYEQFKQAESDKKYTDAALYWQSYVLFKNNHKAKAKRILKRLIKKYPDSQWIDDAQILALEHSTETNFNNATDLEKLELNEELKLYAIQQLMHNNPDKALPLVKNILNNTTDQSVKLNALQLMSISDAKETAQYLYDFILKEKEQTLKNQAVQMLSLRDSMQSSQLLMQLYQQEHNKQLKSSIIQGFIHSDDHEKLARLLDKEQDNELSKQIIQLLGVMGASEELKKISKTIKGDENKSTVIEALALSGDGQSIKDMIENNVNKEFRLKAIRSLIILDDDNTENYLFELYSKFKDIELKREVISVFIATDSDPLKIQALMKNETNKELKSKLIESLMAMDSEQGLLQALKTETNNESKHKIIQMLGAMDATDALNDVYHANMDAEIQKQIILAMGLADQDQDKVFFDKAYKTDNLEIKQAVIQALMLQDDAETLVKLLKKETDNNLKREIIRTISMIDSDYILNNLNLD